MKMYFRDRQDWVKSCADLVKEGVTFNAFSNDLTKEGLFEIELTGGY